MENILIVENLSKKFQKANGESLVVLDNISFQVNKSETMSIVGPSGSGKTTLLGICAGLDFATNGSVSLAGMKLESLDEDERAFLRNSKIGFIFQNFQLLPTLSAIENVSIPLELRGEKDVLARAAEILGKVGLVDRINHYPSQLSGGEQQRVAIARAFVSNPEILFADEPTGNLDEETAETITNLLFNLNREMGTTFVLVTHNLELAQQTQRILSLKKGQISSDVKTNG